jgi:glucose-6-phosphate isomerase
LHFENTTDPKKDFGCSTEQIASLSAGLERIRSEWKDDAAAPSFLNLPKRLHSDYQRDRGASSLGRVFSIANGMHDDIDALVVIGSAPALSVVRAVVGACCDPLHNELTRAQRGSRPRVYFAGDSSDNDTITALLQRLRTPVPESVPSRWAVIVLSDHDPDGTVSQVLSHMLAEMHGQAGDAAPQVLQRYVIPFVHGESWLDRLARSMECQEIFVDDGDVADPLSVMSLANHLPSALLGLDCMRWLGGAHELKENFLHAAMDQNVVLSLLLWKRTAIDVGHANAMSMNVHSDSLGAFARWYQVLRAFSFRDENDSIHVSSCVYPRDHVAGAGTKEKSLQVNIKANIPRTDMLPDPGWSFLAFADDGDASFSECTEAVSDVPGGNLTGRERPGFDLPGFDVAVQEIDTFTLGQLFQLFLIETEVERQLIVA